MKKISIILSIILFAFVANAFAQTTAEAWKQLQDAAQKEIDQSRKEGPHNDASQRAERGRMLLSRMQTISGSNEGYQLDQILGELASCFTSDETTKAIANVSAAIKKERETKQDAYLEEINASLKKATDAIASARTPSDLDEPLKDLARFRNEGGNDRNSEAARTALNQVPNTINFLQRWQDYLSAKASGNKNRARESLQSLTNNDMPGIMPRSQLLAELQKYPTGEEARAEAPKPELIDAIVEKAKTLDGVSDAIKELRQLESQIRREGNYGNSNAINATLNTLVSIERTYREFQAGLPTKLEGPPLQVQDETSPSVIPLRVQLLLLVLPRYMELPPELQAKPGETVQNFLQRMIEEARKRGDTSLLTRVRGAQRLLVRGFYQGDSFPDSAAVNAYRAGQNQEAAGQFMLAVVSYQTALKAGSDSIPAKLIGDRLAGLQAGHPQDYDAGMKQFLTPPARPREFPGGYESPPPESRPPPALPIPGTSAVASIAPSIFPLATPTPPVVPAPATTPKPSPR